MARGIMDVDQAIRTRRSVRGFRPEPVAQHVVAEILRVASRAPSGTNMQPWKVRVLAGAARERLCRAVADPFLAGTLKPDPDYRYYPSEFFEPYRSRRRKVGYDLYGVLGIDKDDHAARHRQHARNYQFFGAPVGMIFTIDRRLEIGSWLDYGMFLENVMLAARARGLHTCPQAAWPPYHQVIRQVLSIPDSEAVVCGMALGVIDPDEPANRLVTERAPLEAFASFEGFEPAPENAIGSLD